MGGIEGVLAAHESTGIKGASWDEPGGMRQSCSCGWEQNYAGRNDHGWGLHRAHVADALREWLLSGAVVEAASERVIRYDLIEGTGIDVKATDADYLNRARAALTAAVETDRASEGER